MKELLGELARSMNARMIRADKESVVMSIPVEGNRQIFGLLHGGANGVLVEHTASILGMFHAPEGRVAVGTELSVSQLRSVTSGNVTATAVPLHIGRTSLCSQVEVRDDEGNLNAVGRMTVVFVSENHGK
ncbi:PaaI family thioesterase [Arcanobacterium haemolyticum]|nr:PaaI family thioesterase [Arcanobacterium haemolyticum]